MLLTDSVRDGSDPIGYVKSRDASKRNEMLPKDAVEATEISQSYFGITNRLIDDSQSVTDGYRIYKLLACTPHRGIDKGGFERLMIERRAYRQIIRSHKHGTRVYVSTKVPYDT